MQYCIMSALAILMVFGIWGCTEGMGNERMDLSSSMPLLRADISSLDGGTMEQISIEPYDLPQMVASVPLRARSIERTEDYLKVHFEFIPGLGSPFGGMELPERPPIRKEGSSFSTGYSDARMPLTNNIILGPGGGQYIELIVDNGDDEKKVRMTADTVITMPITDSSELFRAYLCTENGRSIQSRESFFFHILDSNKVKPNQPMLTYNLPRFIEEYANSVTLDFILTNFGLDTGKVRASIIRDNIVLLEENLAVPGPFRINGLERNRTYKIVLQLLDEENRPLSSSYARKEQIFHTFRPGPGR